MKYYPNSICLNSIVYSHFRGWVCVLALTIMVAQSSYSNGQSSSTKHIFGAPGYKNLTTADGKKIETSYRRLLAVTPDGKKKSLPYSTVAVIHGLFKDPAGGNGFLVLGQVSHDNHGMALIWYKDTEGTAPELLFRTHERLRKSQLAFHQTDDGNIFVISNQGLLLCFNANEKTLARYELDGYYQNPTKMFRPIEGVVSRDGSVLFYSAVDSDYEGKALRDLIRYKDGKFQKIELGETGLSSVKISSEQNLTFLLADSLKTMDIATGKVTSKSIEGPVEGGHKLVPAKIFVRKNGELVSLWRFPKSVGRSGKFSDGFLNRFAEVESGKWVLKEMGLDDLSRHWNPVFAEDKTGRCWFTGTGNGRVIVRHADGEYQNVQTKRIFDYHLIQKIEFSGEDEVLFELNRSSTKTLNIAELLSRKPKTFASWLKVESKTPLIPDLKDNLYGVSPGAESKLLKIANGKIEKIDLPSAEKWSVQSSVYITTDTENQVWLFSDAQNKVAKFDGEKWRIFAAEKRDGVDWSARQVALTETANEIKDAGGEAGTLDYSIGLVGPFQVQFGQDNQILFVSSKKRVQYFDGEKWHAPSAGNELGRTSPVGQPFFENGRIRCMDYRGDCYSMTRDQFREMENASAKRPWKKIKPEESPKSVERRDQRLAGRRYPQTLPMTGKSRPARRGNCFLVLKDNDATIARSDQAWSKISLVDTPLENGKYFEIYSTMASSFIFNIGKERYVYFPPKVDVVAEEISLGDIAKPGETVVPTFKTVPPDLKVVFRYRVADDPWSQWREEGETALLRAVATKAKHKLEVQFNFVGFLVKQKTINYEFTTTYSLQESIDEQVALLASKEFDDRVNATKKLIEFGPAVLPAIDALLESPDTETRVRAKKIATEVRAKLKPIKP